MPSSTQRPERSSLRKAECSRRRRWRYHAWASRRSLFFSLSCQQHRSAPQRMLIVANVCAKGVEGCAEVHLAQKYTLRRSAHTEVLKQSRLQNTYHHRRAARAHPRPLRSPHTAPVPWATLTPHPTTIATPPLPDRLLAKARKPAPIPSAYSCKRAALCAEEGRAPGSGRPGAPIVGLRVLVGARSTAAMWGRDRYMHRTGPRSTTPRHSRRECPGHELIRLMTIVM